MSTEKDAAPADPGSMHRFTVSQRIEHLILAVSFTVLSLTGLPQFFAPNHAATWLIEFFGGIEKTRIIHRWASVVFSALAVYHFIVVAYRIYVRRVAWTMAPGPKDITDAWHLLRYNAFLAPDPPHMPRYSFTEKVEYWALIWGGVIMAMTGFMLWNPLITTRFLPGQFIPAAKAAHGGEAILAVLAIIVWHFYNVHVKFFNKSMFTGKLSKHQMEEEHGDELEQLVSGFTPPVSDPRDVRRRRMLFIPAAVAFAAGGIGSIYWAATAENTAIQTLPAVTKPQVSGPETSSPLPGGKLPAVSAPLIPHPVEGQEQCNGCHSRSALKPMPKSHEGRPVASCQICHRPGPVRETPKPDRRETSAGKPSPIPHSIEGDMYKNCTQCHGAGMFKPFPANHAKFSAQSCTACHRPAAKVDE